MLIIICILGALISGTVAAGKNRNPLGWGALGFLLPGVVVALCLSTEGDAPAV